MKKKELLKLRTLNATSAVYTAMIKNTRKNF